MRFISLGAGVQSTTMALMAAHGELTPMPDGAIFADTGDEPVGVYEHLRWLMSDNVLPFPVHICSAGRLSEALFAGEESARIPFFTETGMKQRQCTRNFKIRPIRRKVRELIGKPRGRIPTKTVEQWIGISTDEAWRMKPAVVGFITNRWPLIEKRVSRRDCIAWLTSRGYPIPRKSACVYCPYQSDVEWRSRRNGPAADWELAKSVDAKLRTPDQIARFRGKLYAHRSLRPLDQVDLSTAEERGQLNLFLNECEGMCGV